MYSEFDHLRRFNFLGGKGTFGCGSEVRKALFNQNFLELFAGNHQIKSGVAGIGDNQLVSHYCYIPNFFHGNDSAGKDRYGALPNHPPQLQRQLREVLKLLLILHLSRLRHLFALLLLNPSSQTTKLGAIITSE